MTGIFGIVQSQPSRIERHEAAIDAVCGKLARGEIDGKSFGDSVLRIVVVADAIDQEIESRRA